MTLSFKNNVFQTVKDLTNYNQILVDLRRDNRRYKSFMHAVPYHYCGWGSLGTQVISPDFEAGLIKSRVTCFEDLTAIFCEQDAKKLKTSFLALSNESKTFELTLKSHDEEHIFRVMGVNASFDADESFSILWFDEVTETVTELSNYLDEIKELKASRDLYESRFSIMPFPIWFRDGEGKIIWCNKAYASIFDASLEKVLEEDLELLEKEKARLLADKARALKVVQKEQMHIAIDGRRCLFEITELPLASSSETLGFAHDLTDFELLQKELLRLKETNANVLEQLNLPIAIYAPDMSLSFYNASYANIWGLQESWLNTNPFINEIFDDLRQKRKLPEQANFRDYVDQWRSFFTNLIKSHQEMMYLPNGTVLRTIVVPHPQGGLVVSHEDVTSRLELESSYNTLMAVQRETIDHLAEGLCVYGADGRLKLYNKALMDIWDLEEKKLERQPHITEIVDWLKSYFLEEEWDYTREELISSTLAGKAQSGRFARADGSVLDYRLVPLPDGGLLVSYLDVTDTVNVENALIEKNTALEAADQLKSGFLANVSYQLRNPLNAIIGFADILDQKYFGDINEKQTEYVRDIAKAGKDLVSLIDDILDLSTIEAGYLELDLKSVKISELLDNVRDIASEWGGQNHSIVVNYPKNIGSITIDALRIKQVLLNLIQNAIHFNNEHGQVLVSVSRKKDHVAFVVKDDGVGIADEDLETIFKPFTRAQQTKEKRGMGVGLSLVKSIVELHEGELSIESVLGEGTTVNVKLPCP